jgi:hypothetical protein
MGKGVGDSVDVFSSNIETIILVAVQDENDGVLVQGHGGVSWDVPSPIETRAFEYFF